MGNTLEQNIKELRKQLSCNELDKAFNSSKLIFLKTNKITYLTVCISLFIYGLCNKEEIEILIDRVNDDSLRNYFHGIISIHFSEWDRASEIYLILRKDDSLDRREMPLIRLETTHGYLHFIIDYVHIQLAAIENHFLINHRYEYQTLRYELGEMKFEPEQRINADDRQNYQYNLLIRTVFLELDRLSIDHKYSKLREIEEIKNGMTTNLRYRPLPNITSTYKLDSFYPGVDEPNNRWEKIGDDWIVIYKNVKFPLKHYEGVGYITWLLANPGKEFTVEALDENVNPDHYASDATRANSVGEHDKYNQRPKSESNIGYDTNIDEQAVLSYKEQIIKLGDRYEIAKDTGNKDLMNKILEEIDDIKSQLKKDIDKYGRKRKIGSESIKIRKKIRSDIQYSLQVIDKKHPELAQHLQKSIIIREFICYRSSDNHNWLITF